MENPFIEEQTFERNDYTETALEKADYELCTFLNCDFSNSDLSKIRFTDCEFHNCNLSSANLFQTGFQDVLFKGCKMLGLFFDKCSDFAFSILVDNCQLNHSSFYQKKISKIKFKESKLIEVDFTECDLTASVFDACDLSKAIFDRTLLQKADFVTSFNYTIDPEINQIKGAKFSLQSVSGLLAKYNIKIESNL